MVTYEAIPVKSYPLSAEGQGIAANGSNEYLVWQALAGGVVLSAAELGTAVGAGVAKIGQGNAMKNKWIGKSGAGFVRTVS